MKDPEKARESWHRYYQAHKEEICQRRRDLYASDPARRERERRYREEHKDQIRERKRRYYYEVIKPRELRELFE